MNRSIFVEVFVTSETVNVAPYHAHETRTANADEAMCEALRVFTTAWKFEQLAEDMQPQMRKPRKRSAPIANVA